MTWGGISAPANWSPCAARTFKPSEDFFNFPGRSARLKSCCAAAPPTSPAAAFSVTIGATGDFSCGSGVFSPVLDGSAAVIGGGAVATTGRIGIGLCGTEQIITTW